MRRACSWVCRLGSVALLGVVGCQTADGHRWTLPWEKPVAKEEIVVPPLADGRYTDPQSLPKSAMSKGLPAKPAAELAKPGAGPGGMGGMGAMPASGRGGYGGY